MPGEKLYDIIEQYLDNKLDADALAAFELRLSNEPELVNEVKLHRKIQEELGNAPKRNLRTRLDQLRSEFTLEEKKEKIIPINRNRQLRNTLSIAAVILLFGLFIWLMFIRQPASPEIAEDPTPTEEENKTPPGIDPIQEKDPNQIANDQAPDDSKNDDAPDKNPIQTPDQNAIAAETPNPVFENLIAQNDSESGYDFNVENPISELTITAQDQAVDFYVKGMLLTAHDVEKNILEVVVFNNQNETVDFKKALSTLSLSLEKPIVDEDDEDFAMAGLKEYYFNLEERLSLSPGLYYYVISPQNDDKVLYVSKFVVTKK